MDPSAFSVDGGPSIAERMFYATNGKIAFRRADNRRIGALGALSGWDQVRSRMIGEETDVEGKTVPMLYVFSNCSHLIRTIPSMQHDADRPEDLMTDSEDHAVDALRYGCMSRPYVRQESPRNRKPRTVQEVSLNELYASIEEDRSASGRI